MTCLLTGFLVNLESVFMKKLSFLMFSMGVTFTLQAQHIPSTVDSIFAPVRVGTPPSDAYIGLSKLETGEIRHYNFGEQAVPGNFYLSSKDNGLTWRRVNTPVGMPFADRQSPVSKEYIRVTHMPGMGVYCIRTEGGLNGGRSIIKIAETNSIMVKPPIFIHGGKRIVVAAHGDVTPKGCYTYVSDDDGLTWKRSNIVTTPNHEKGGFHKGIRWNHGAVEPTVIELNDGKLWMIMRTSLDYHYEAFSEDGGLTWSETRPSPFYGTITMPTMNRLEDGRLLFFWCNTTPLPEMETATGVWDDVFTNRDVTHVAISEDDGKTWIGFRELYLTPKRNDSQYAGGGMDRSTHQAQMVEVVPGKILASIGQHETFRSMMLFDVDWLYETERFNDFSDGLDQWTVFNYIKGIKGHCSYNRIAGCSLVPHKEKEGKQVLSVKYKADETLVADTRGAVWNFPCMKQGVFKAGVRIPKGSEEVYLLLNDRWMNPSDTVARYECMYELKLSREQLGIRDEKWHEISISWDLEQKNSIARVQVDGKKRNLRLQLKRPTLHGISYAHFMACPANENPGIEVEWVKASKKIK